MFLLNYKWMLPEIHTMKKCNFIKPITLNEFKSLFSYCRLDTEEARARNNENLTRMIEKVCSFLA